jgi:signal transduction histidine kinase
MLFLQVRREGLGRSLRDLARKFEATTGIEVRFRVTGNVASLPTVGEDALFRVAHEALRNAERHSEASSVALALSYGHDGVAVAVTDDGVGLGDRNPFDHPEGHFGLHGLQTLLEEVGGDLEICDLQPHGVRIEGRIPFKSRARSASA